MASRKDQKEAARQRRLAEEREAGDQDWHYSDIHESQKVAERVDITAQIVLHYSLHVPHGRIRVQVPA